MLLRKQMELIINDLVDSNILLEEAVSEFEQLYIKTALSRNADHLSNTATALGIHRNTLAKRIAGYEAQTKKQKIGLNNGRPKKRSAARR